MGPHIRNFLTKEGMDPLPGALTPAQSDFFDPPTNPTPVDPKMYQSTQGGLVFYTPTRSDVKPYVNATLPSSDPLVSAFAEEGRAGWCRYLVFILWLSRRYLVFWTESSIFWTESKPFMSSKEIKALKKLQQGV
jgi:hypothetical protein